MEEQQVAAGRAGPLRADEETGQGARGGAEASPAAHRADADADRRGLTAEVALGYAVRHKRAEGNGQCLSTTIN